MRLDTICLPDQYYGETLAQPIRQRRFGAIKTDLFADIHHRGKLDTLGDPLAGIEACIDFAALSAEVGRIAPRPVSAQGSCPPYPSESMGAHIGFKTLVQPV